MVWILIGFLICMVAGCYVAYKEAKIHELHKMRAAFENRVQDVKNTIGYVKDYEVDDEEEINILKGEVLGLENGLNMLKEEGADEDLIDEIKKDIEELKKKLNRVKE